MLSLLHEWVVNPLPNDFGFDYDVRITNPIDDQTQQVTRFSFYIQQKASIHTKGTKAIEQMNIVDLKLYLQQNIPVLIVKYDKPQDIFFWVIAQNYIWDILEKEDPDWKRQDTKVIHLTKRLDNLEILKKEILLTQSRIIRYKSLNMNFLEGIDFTRENLQELRQQKNYSLQQFKKISLVEANDIHRDGDLSKAFELYNDIYKSPKDDESKINAIIGMIDLLSIIDDQENKKIVYLAEEGMKIAEELQFIYYTKYIRILRNEAFTFKILKKISEVLISKKISKLEDDPLFMFFYNEELKKYREAHNRIAEEINSDLLWLINEKSNLFLIAIPRIIRHISHQILTFAIFNKDIINDEIKGRSNFIKQCIKIIEFTNDPDILKMLYRELANYYYTICKRELAFEYIEKALEKGNEAKDDYFIENTNKFIDIMKERKTLYDIPKQKSVDEMTTKEFQKITKKLLEAQGIDLNSDDKLSKSIKIALNDLNPEECFKHCRNINIEYISTSLVGRNIGLPSMGSKVIGCKGKGWNRGFNLHQMFRNFKLNYCNDCRSHSPRSANWICMVKWVKEQAKDPEFVQVLKNIEESINRL